MNLTISGHHVDVTEPLHKYVEQKLQRVLRHFDQIVDIRVLLSVDNKVKDKDKSQKAECTLHVKGEDLFAQSTHSDLYAAIDALVDKLARQVQKHKEKLQKGHGHDGLKRTEAV